MISYCFLFLLSFTRIKSKSLSTNTKPAKCDHNELEQAILDEFDQLSISRMRKT